MKTSLTFPAKTSINLKLGLLAVVLGMGIVWNGAHAATITDVRNIAKSLNEESWQIMYKGKLTSTPQVTLNAAKHTLTVNLGSNSIETSFLKYPFNVAGSVINQIDFYHKNKNNSQITFNLNSPIQLKTVYDQNSIKLIISYTAQVNIPPLTVAIDPGHGGKDPGAIGKVYGIYEKYVTFSIATSLYNILQQDPNFTPVLTRTGDYFIPVPQRSVIARQKHANVLISIHADSSSNRHAIGSSVWVLSTRRAQTETGRLLEHEDVRDSKISGIAPILTDNKSFNQKVIDLQFNNQIRLSTGLAQDVIGQLDKIANLHSKKPQFASLGVLKSPDFPSILVETGFLSNRVEESRLRNPRYRQEIAVAIYNGLKSYYNQNKAQYLSTTHVTPAAIRQQVIPQSALQIKTGNSDSNASSIIIGTKKYKIQAGDTLYGLANKFNVSYQQIVSVNKLKNDQIYVGQVINLPEVQTVPLPAVATNLDFSHTIPYVVQAGDNLNRIAFNHHITLDDLLKANPKLNKANRKVLYIGETLAIPTILADNANVTYESETSLTDSGTDYKVKAGDTLSQIALKYDLDVDDIVEFNHLKSKNIYVGQKLNIPQVVVKQVPVTGDSSNHDHDDDDDNTDQTVPTTLSVHNQELAASIKARLATIPPSDSVAQSIINAKIAQNPQVAKQYANSGKIPVQTKLVDSGNTYKVRSGDYLSRIASKYNVSTANLISFNKLNKRGHIYVGQVLKIPTLQTTPIVPVPKIQNIDTKEFAKGTNIPVKVINVSPTNSNVTSTSASATSNTLVDSGKRYKVRSGDALSLIARKYKVSVANLSKFNNLKANRIFVGQVLKVPILSQNQTSTLGTNKGIITNNGVPQVNQGSATILLPTSTTNGSSKIFGNPNNLSTVSLIKYTVKRGDTLGFIARKFKVSLNQIVKANNLNSSSQIYVGQNLTIPQVQYFNNNAGGNGNLNQQLHGVDLNDSSVTSPVTNFTSNDILSTRPAIIAHRVKAGDALASIASQYGVTVPQLLQANKLSSRSKLQVGQILVIPDVTGNVVSYDGNPSLNPSSYGTVKPTTTITTTYGNDQLVVKDITYKVKSGDILSVIAEKYNIGLSVLLKANNLTLKSRIHPGQILKIPGASVKSLPTSVNITPYSSNKVSTVNANPSYNVVDSRTVNSSSTNTGLANPRFVSNSSSSSSSTSYVKHTIKRGEVLSVIAEKYNIGLSVLLKANNLTMRSPIHPGQVLNIPQTTVAKTTSSVSSTKPSPKVNTKSLIPVVNPKVNSYPKVTNRTYAQTVSSIPKYTTHVVRAGESLGVIAEKYHMGLSVLKALNHLKSNHIYVGQKLKVAIGR